MRVLNQLVGSVRRVRRGSLGWTAAALSGIAITAGVTWGASQLFAQPIGLASMPLSVVSSLAPAKTPAAARPAPPVITFMTPQPQTSSRVAHRRNHRRTVTHSTVTVTLTQSALTATSPPPKLTGPAVTTTKSGVTDVGHGSQPHAPTNVVAHKHPKPSPPANPKAPVVTQTTTTVTVAPAAPATPGASNSASSPAAPAGTQTTTTASNTQTTNAQQGGSTGGSDDYGGGDGSDNEGGGDGHEHGGTTTTNTTTTGGSTSGGGGGRDD